MPLGSARVFRYSGVNDSDPVPYSSYGTGYQVPAVELDNTIGSRMVRAQMRRYPVQPTPPLPCAPLRLLANVTATGGNVSTDFQTIEVTDTTEINSDPGLLIIDPGGANQEVITYVAVDGTHFSTICMRNHVVGERLVKLMSYFTQFLQFTVSGLDPAGAGIADVTFIRLSPLPYGIYDQFLLRGVVDDNSTFSYVSEPSAPWYSSGIWASGSNPIPNIPQYDPTLVDSYGIPTNGIALNAGPLYATSTGGVVNPCVQVQVLSTVTPEPETADLEYGFLYRIL